MTAPSLAAAAAAAGAGTGDKTGETCASFGQKRF